MGGWTTESLVYDLLTHGELIITVTMSCMAMNQLCIFSTDFQSQNLQLLKKSVVIRLTIAVIFSGIII